MFSVYVAKLIHNFRDAKTNGRLTSQMGLKKQFQDCMEQLRDVKHAYCLGILIAESLCRYMPKRRLIYYFSQLVPINSLLNDPIYKRENALTIIKIPA